MSTRTAESEPSVDVFTDGNEVRYRGTKSALIAAGIARAEWFPGRRGAGWIEADDEGGGSRVEYSRFQEVMDTSKTIRIHRAGRYGFEVWVRTPRRTMDAANPNVSPGLPLRESWNNSFGPACSIAEKDCSAEFECDKLAFESLLVAKLCIECARVGRDVVRETLKRERGFAKLAEKPLSFHSIHIAARLYCSPLYD